MMMDSYKKQAEQLSSMLSDIKKDKEEIQGIDDLIRNEKWDEARKLVENNSVADKKEEEPIKEEPIQEE